MFPYTREEINIGYRSSDGRDFLRFQAVAEVSDADGRWRKFPLSTGNSIHHALVNTVKDLFLQLHKLNQDLKRIKPNDPKEIVEEKL